MLKKILINLVEKVRGGLNDPSRRDAVRAMINRKCSELGPVTYHEAWVLFMFVSLVLLWFFQVIMINIKSKELHNVIYQEPGFMTGWADKLETVNAIGNPVSVGSATPAVLVAIILFMFPSKPYFVK